MNRIKLHKIVLIFAAFMLSNSLLCCICYGPGNFDLLTYDTQSYIFEVTVNSLYKSQPDSLQLDSVKPPSLFDRDLLNSYNITVNEVYKGNVDPGMKHMGFPKGSSCSWTPEIGMTYIFYTNWINGIEMCDRKVVLEYNQMEFETEKKILRILKESADIVSIKVGERMLFNGKNDKGLRVGTWFIYSLAEPNEIAFELDYENGKLMRFRTGPGYNELDRWQYIVYREYQGMIPENKD